MKCPECEGDMPLAVHRSAAGYYIGYFCGNCGPYSRVTDYFTTRETAESFVTHNKTALEGDDDA